MRRRAASSRLLPLGLSLLWMLAGAPAVAAASDGSVDFEFKGLNRTYSTLLTGLEPFRQGPLTVHLLSPRNVLTVEEHRLRLTPGNDGEHAGRVEARISGEGLLLAEIEISGATQTLKDEVVVPRQTVAADLKLRIEPVPDGYSLTALELPATVKIEIRSQVVRGVVSVCRAMALLPLMSLDCNAVESSLSWVAVPLPAPGSSYLLPADQLSDDERSRLDGYLSSGPAAPPTQQ